ncbi:MAG: N-6 DNA methylase [bacterium]
MTNQSTANLGFETKLWAAADKLRGHMDSSEYKHVVLGLIFLKYISDSFEETHQSIKNDNDAYEGEWEDKDAYQARNIFWVPEIARWEYLKQNAKKPEIGKIVDDAMVAIEKENPTLKGVLPKRYARPDLNKQSLGEIIDIFSSLELGDSQSKSKDLLGRVYEYFIGRFASAEGKGGGEFYTPASVVKLLVAMIEPYKGRVFDPCCGSGGMFVQSERFVQEHGGKVGDIAVYGQESNPTTWKLCKMNLAIRGIEGNLGESEGDSFHNDLHKDLKADFILANPPFNDSDWGGERLRDDVRWKYGVPSTSNANYAWIQHFVHHLSPTGIAGFVMSSGALSSNSSNEGGIRENLVKAGMVDCIVALPDKLFYTTGIPASLWFISRDRYNHKFRDRHDEILFIDARKMGIMTDRKHRELTEGELRRIAQTYHDWRNNNGKYGDVKGFSKAAQIKEVEKNGYVLSPGRYVGTDFEFEGEDQFIQNMQNLSLILFEQLNGSRKLNDYIELNLKKTITFLKNGTELVTDKEYPEDWETERVENLAERVGIGPFGSSIKVETFVKTGIPIISGQHLNHFFLEDLDYNFITEEHARRLRNSIVKRGDIILTHAGNIGQVSFIPTSSKYKEYIISQRQFYIRCDASKIVPEFLTYYLRSPLGQHSLLSNRTQTGVPSISRPVTNIRNLLVPLPSIDEQKRIVQTIIAIDSLNDLNRKMNTTFEKIEKSLIPRLMSGKLRVN